MHPRRVYFLKTAAALSFLAGCAAEPSPDPANPPDSPPDGGFRLQGRVVDASGATAAFVLVRLGGPEGPIVATDEAGGFAFSDVAAGKYSLYAHDTFAASAGVASIELAPASQDSAVTIELQPCGDALDDVSPDGIVLHDICLGIDVIDLPPAQPAVVLGAVELSGGTGFTQTISTTVHKLADSGVREVFFAFQDGLARGGVRELAVEDHLLVGSGPDPDPYAQPTFTITLEDSNGSQTYAVRDGSFRVEVIEAEDGTRSFVLTASELVLDYRKSFEELDPAYTLTVPSLRVEGAMDAYLPPVAPGADLTADLTGGFVTNDYDSANQVVDLDVIGPTSEILHLELDLARLALPGTVDVELPLGEKPNLEGDVLTMDAGAGGLFSFWTFQLVSYSVTTEMTELPACGGTLTLALENLVFRYVDWDYDENSDQVLRFGDQTLTIDRVDVATVLYDFSVPDCF
jgi:hypothetical protein